MTTISTCVCGDSRTKDVNDWGTDKSRQFKEWSDFHFLTDGHRTITSRFA